MLDRNTQYKKKLQTSKWEKKKKQTFSLLLLLFLIDCKQ